MFDLEPTKGETWLLVYIKFARSGISRVRPLSFLNIWIFTYKFGRMVYAYEQKISRYEKVDLNNHPYFDHTEFENFPHLSVSVSLQRQRSSIFLIFKVVIKWIWILSKSNIYWICYIIIPRTGAVREFEENDRACL